MHRLTCHKSPCTTTTSSSSSILSTRALYTYFSAVDQTHSSYLIRFYAHPTLIKAVQHTSKTHRHQKAGPGTDVWCGSAGKATWDERFAAAGAARSWMRWQSKCAAHSALDCFPHSPGLSIRLLHAILRRAGLRTGGRMAPGPGSAYKSAKAVAPGRGRGQRDGKRSNVRVAPEPPVSQLKPGCWARNRRRCCRLVQCPCRLTRWLSILLIHEHPIGCTTFRCGAVLQDSGEHLEAQAGDARQRASIDLSRQAVGAAFAAATRPGTGWRAPPTGTASHATHAGTAAAAQDPTAAGAEGQSTGTRQGPPRAGEDEAAGCPSSGGGGGCLAQGDAAPHPDVPRQPLTAPNTHRRSARAGAPPESLYERLKQLRPVEQQEQLEEQEVFWGEADLQVGARER